MSTEMVSMATTEAQVNVNNIAYKCSDLAF